MFLCWFYIDTNKNFYLEQKKKFFSLCILDDQLKLEKKYYLAPFKLQ